MQHLENMKIFANGLGKTMLNVCQIYMLWCKVFNKHLSSVWQMIGRQTFVINVCQELLPPLWVTHGDKKYTKYFGSMR